MSFKISDFFNESKIEELARKHEFVQRQSKLSGFRFLDALLFTRFDNKMLALENLCLQLFERFNIKLQKQALDQRFNYKAVGFLKDLFKKLLSYQLSLVTSPDQYPFHSIWLRDSCCFQLPESMKNAFPGSGGDGSNASARLQCEVELVSGFISDLSLNAFNEQDITNAKQTADDISPGALLIRDLGYWDAQQMKTINEKGAYYISRIPTGTKAYEYIDGTYIPIDFSEIERYMLKHQIQTIDKPIYMGETKIPTRLIIDLLPEKEKHKRLQKAKYQAGKKRRILSNAYKARAGLNLYVTNLTPEEIQPNEAIKFYRLRWQIELIFKAWKSIGEIHKVKNMKLERFLCMIYAKLIWVLLNWEILAGLNWYFERQKGFSVSFYKGYKYLTNQFIDFRRAIMYGRESLRDFINKLAMLSPKYLIREKRKHKESLMEYLKELKLVN